MAMRCDGELMEGGHRKNGKTEKHLSQAEASPKLSQQQQHHRNSCVHCWPKQAKIKQKTKKKKWRENEKVSSQQGEWIFHNTINKKQLRV